MTVPDVIKCPRLDKVHMTGLLGERLRLSRLNRLHFQEEYHLLWPFQEHCPIGRENQPHPEITRGDWHGEFLGDYVSVASLTAWNACDEKLRIKINRMVEAWLATQNEDGYLGTYDEKDRWKSWDLWVQAHAIMGLLAYYDYTSKKEVLQAAVRVANRILEDFGLNKRSVHETGPHGGLASSAILEPIMGLWKKTWEPRFLEFSKWLVDQDWESSDGPAIISSLLKGLGVAEIANAKGIEMLKDLAGVVEIYRATGNKRYLNPILAAWNDIVEHQLYVTGSATTGAVFQTSFVLRNDGQFKPCETCVTVGWIYLNMSLGRLTGEAKYFDMIEQALYNHLLAAQSPDGLGWAYHVGLRDHKRYSWHTDPDCCPNRGPKGLALIPQYIFGVDHEGVVVNFYEQADATLTLQSGFEVKIEQKSRYPFDGTVHLKINPTKRLRFTVRLRVPRWCTKFSLALNEKNLDISKDDRGYIVIERVWDYRDTLKMEFDMPIRVMEDSLGNNQHVALMRGPLVFAADSSYLPDKWLLDDIVLMLDPQKISRNLCVSDTKASDTVHLLVAACEANPEKNIRSSQNGYRYMELTDCCKTKCSRIIEMVPFFEAGNRDPDCFREGVCPDTVPVTNYTYKVWLHYRCN